jgi:hypothetical protein
MKVGMAQDGTGADMPTRRTMVGAVRRVSKAGNIESGTGWLCDAIPLTQITSDRRLASRCVDASIESFANLKILITSSLDGQRQLPIFLPVQSC